MGVLIQIKDVPEDVHRILKSRAALAGMSLTEYVREMLVSVAGRPSREELIAELSQIEPRAHGESAVETIRHIRAEYE